jgi:hypothetical protein
MYDWMQPLSPILPMGPSPLPAPAPTWTVGICPYCGFWHTGMCSRIKAIEYHENGMIRRIEFHDGLPCPGQPTTKQEGASCSD